MKMMENAGRMIPLSPLNKGSICKNSQDRFPEWRSISGQKHIVYICIKYSIIELHSKLKIILVCFGVERYFQGIYL